MYLTQESGEFVCAAAKRKRASIMQKFRHSQRDYIGELIRLLLLTYDDIITIGT